MCLIIKTDNPKQLHLGLLETAYLNNSDGFGVMFYNQGKLHTQKIAPKSFKDIEKLWSKYKDLNVPMGLHFRFNTMGDTSRAMSHPFEVLSKSKGDDRDLWVMHNGPQLPTPLIDNNKSDTHQFIKWVLRPQLSANPKLLYNAEWQEMIEELIGTDKLLFLDGKTKEFVIYNESEGKDVDNIGWLSNTYSIQPTYSSVRDYEYDFENQTMKKVDKWGDYDDYENYNGSYGGSYASGNYGGYGFNRVKQIENNGNLTNVINENVIAQENKLDQDYTAITHYDREGKYTHTDFKPTASGTKRELVPYTQISPDMKGKIKPKDSYIEDAMFNGKELEWSDVCYRDLDELEDLCEENPKGIAHYIYDLILGGNYDDK
tara:strand:- start:11592 stop:12710 length:1119 start_codon:yes stop_codon:yes gene_type:complete